MWLYWPRLSRKENWGLGGGLRPPGNKMPRIPSPSKGHLDCPSGTSRRKSLVPVLSATEVAQVKFITLLA